MCNAKAGSQRKSSSQATSKRRKNSGGKAGESSTEKSPQKAKKTQNGIYVPPVPRHCRKGKTRFVVYQSYRG
jgi:hypothetical protein